MLCPKSLPIPLNRALYEGTDIFMVSKTSGRYWVHSFNPTMHCNNKSTINVLAKWLEKTHNVLWESHVKWIQESFLFWCTNFFAKLNSQSEFSLTPTAIQFFFYCTNPKHLNCVCVCINMMKSHIPGKEQMNSNTSCTFHLVGSHGRKCWLRRGSSSGSLPETPPWETTGPELAAESGEVASS